MQNRQNKQNKIAKKSAKGYIITALATGLAFSLVFNVILLNNLPQNTPTDLAEISAPQVEIAENTENTENITTNDFVWIPGSQNITTDDFVWIPGSRENNLPAASFGFMPLLPEVDEIPFATSLTIPFGTIIPSEPIFPGATGTFAQINPDLWVFTPTNTPTLTETTLHAGTVPRGIFTEIEPNVWTFSVENPALVPNYIFSGSGRMTATQLPPGVILSETTLHAAARDVLNAFEPEIQPNAAFVPNYVFGGSSDD
ncbi:MAG: hypothetical protein FWG68_06650 [Defluviitaleaceae bacterium]|nr:hypothetical protein [Defluviitaleaceae bacterium]